MSQGPVVFVVDDEPAVRDSLNALLGTYGFTVESFASGRELLDRVRGRPAGCVVADVRMPGIGGIALQRELKRRDIPLPVVIITGHGDVPMAVEALKAGAVDFIEKPIDDARLVSSIRDALDHDRAAREQSGDATRIVQRAGTLTERESQVMDLVVVGISNNAIAEKLGISPRTVEHYRANIMQKMRASSLAHLVRMTMRIGRPGR
ncbi:MAG: response regulator FixJ [Rhodospirillales bacterium]